MTATKKTTTRKRASTTKKVTATKPKKVVAQKIPDLPKNPFAYEVLDAASKMRSKANKVEVIRRYGDNSLKAVLIWNFDESIVTLLPEGEVPYGSNLEDETKTGTLSGKIDDAVSKMNELGSSSLGSQDQGQTTIRKEFTKFYNFLKGGNPGMSSLRRESMFINILQGLHPLEAEILILVKDGRLTDKYNITKDVASEAFPDIVWGGRS
ncbi:MAG: hypothetical protein CMO72_07460 [Verrucomicrobiales bacterium]|nr:hypothetical protein [Verrucomicrobiales bacterium]|tara:strand:- start:452 stop:1078 length:627 start_codon:yes stop_codon:yes gene_type:complete